MPKISDEDQRVIFEIAFAIEDPCGFDALILAREMLFFARRIRPEHRDAVARFFASTIITETYIQSGSHRIDLGETHEQSDNASS